MLTYFNKNPARPAQKGAKKISISQNRRGRWAPLEFSKSRSGTKLSTEVMTIMDDPEEGPHVYEATCVLLCVADSLSFSPIHASLWHLCTTCSWGNSGGIIFPCAQMAKNSY